jgi:hypothetical protein
MGGGDYQSASIALSKKLGITKTTIVRVIGEVCDEALEEALAVAARISQRRTRSLIVACVDSPEALHADAERDEGAAVEECSNLDGVCERARPCD